MKILLGVTLSCAVVVSLGVGQTPSTSLPAFTVTAADGTTTPSSSLPTAGRRLLLYVDPRLSSSDDLLQLWRDDDPSGFLVVIVVRLASAADLATIRERYPALNAAVWYADTDGSVLAALKLPGTPAAVALDASTVAWTVRGVLPNGEQMRTLLFDWVRGR